MTIGPEQTSGDLCRQPHEVVWYTCDQLFPRNREPMSHPMMPTKILRSTGTMLVFGMLLSGIASAADTPPVATAPLATPPGLPGQTSGLSDDPGHLLNILADYLDKDPDHVVIQVGTIPITQDDLAGVIRSMPPNQGNLPGPEIYRRALDVMVRQKAMVLRAKQDHLDHDPALIRQGQVAFERIISDAWLRRRSDSAVTEQALHALYDQQYANKPGPDEVHARVILLPTEAEAMPLIESLRKGADFADLARTHSKDPTAAKGGDLGYLSREATTPELGAVMFALAPGQVTAYPVATFIGYFIIRIEGRRSGPPLTFEQVRARLEHQLREEAVRTAIGSLLSNVKLIQPTDTRGTDAPK